MKESTYIETAKEVVVMPEEYLAIITGEGNEEWFILSAPEAARLI